MGFILLASSGFIPRDGWHRFNPTDSHHSQKEMSSSSMVSFAILVFCFCFNLIFCPYDDCISFVVQRQRVSSRREQINHSVGRGQEEISLYTFGHALVPLFACLFRLDVIRRKETNSDLISITFCDDSAHFFFILLPFPSVLLACIVGIYSLCWKAEKKKIRWPSLQFPY